MRAIDENDEYLRNDKNIHQVLVVLWYQKMVVNHLVGGVGGDCYSGHLEHVGVLVKIQNDDVQSWLTSV